jgi:phage protein
MARNLARVCDSEYKNAIRLIRTETNFVANEGAAKAYESQGVESYEYLAALDLRTSEICREMDGKVFALKDKVTGKNYPPLHTHCRSTTVPYIPDLEGTRIARAHDGKTYKVDRHMNYKDCYDKYVRTNPKELLKEKQIKNASKDKLQYQKYKERLGKNAPKSLAEFVDIKYNKDRWELFKSYAKTVRIGELTPLADFSLYEKIDREIATKLVGKTLRNGYRISGYSKHFISRTIGSTEQKRTGVSVDDSVKILEEYDEIKPIRKDKNGNSQRILKKGLGIVSINPDTKELIQVNPHKDKKDR